MSLSYFLLKALYGDIFPLSTRWLHVTGFACNILTVTYSEGFCLPNVQDTESLFPKKLHVLEKKQFYTGIDPPHSWWESKIQTLEFFPSTLPFTILS